MSKVHPVEMAAVRILLHAVILSFCLGAVAWGAYMIGVGFTYLATGSWLTLGLDLQPATTTKDWAVTATAWGLIGGGVTVIILYGGGLLFSRERRAYRRERKAARAGYQGSESLAAEEEG